MAKKPESTEAAENIDGAVAATLTGIIYQAGLFNRQAKVNVPEEEVTAEVINLWRNVKAALNSESVPEVSA